MFDHTNFIIAAYAAAAIILSWCAIAPILKTRRVRRMLAAALARESGDKNA